VLTVNRKLAGILGALGNLGVFVSVAAFGLVLNESAPFSVKLRYLILGIAALTALSIALVSLANEYKLPVAGKAKTLSIATLVTYLLSILFAWKDPEGSLSALFLIVFIVLLVLTKKEVYQYASNTSSAFGIIARVYGNIKRHANNGPYGPNTVVVATEEYHNFRLGVHIIGVIILGILAWFTVEPIVWLYWGFTGK